MKRSYLSFDDFKREALKDPVIKAEYDRLEPEFAIIQAVIDARINKGITQQKLAKKMGTTQSAIARLESGNANPSVSFLQKLAQALNSKLEIKFTAVK
ncbi:MAG: helix-turn-helix transcriptional regulator [Candidatus Daviesbacteria bacterium]|nr:helix-turn-helix transcriptional regulator [Candidatus Daviesbacteria bacterium]